MRIGTLKQWEIIILIAAYFIKPEISIGQDHNDFLYPSVPESVLFETQWQYAYTLHVESQTVLHQSGENFKAYYYFRLDHSSESFVNKKYDSNSWQIHGALLRAPILNLDSLLIVKATENQLILETQNKNGKGHLQYYLEKLDPKEQIFNKPGYLLPEVDVTTKTPKSRKDSTNSWLSNLWDWLWGDSQDVPYKPEPTFINIEMIGGGFFGGIDPAIKNYIRLKTDGRLLREYASEYHGLTKTSKNIGRTELEAFVEYLDTKGFFNLNSNYDCTDPQCLARLASKPRPIPLRISVTYGLKQKVVNIAVFGFDERNYKYLEYPPLIDNIVEIMNRMANRVK